jgi:hypothetical protein
MPAWQQQSAGSDWSSGLSGYLGRALEVAVRIEEQQAASVFCEVDLDVAVGQLPGGGRRSLRVSRVRRANWLRASVSHLRLPGRLLRRASATAPRVLPATIDLPTAARALGVGRTKAYELAKRDRFAWGWIQRSRRCRRLVIT